MCIQKKHKCRFVPAGIIIIICLLTISFIYQKNVYIRQIKDTVSCCAQNEIDNKYISHNEGTKIYESIQANWDEEGGVKIEKAECCLEDEKWDERYVCICIHYKGTLGNGEKIEESEYYKINFKIGRTKIYISEVNVSVGGETGVYTDRQDI